MLPHLKKIILPLFVATLLGTLADQWITLKLENQLRSPAGAGAALWGYGSLSLLLGLLYPLTTLLISLSSLTDENLFVFLTQHGSQTLREQMRAWGKVSLWSFLLLIPGIIYFFRLIFVPFIVCFDPEYKSGSVDALEKSKTLSKGKLPTLFILFFLFSLAIPSLFTVVDEYKLLWNSPIEALVICFFEMLLNFYFLSLLWNIYSHQRRHYET